MTKILAILNVTPDSFSDGGKHNTVEKALKRAKQLESNGANMIDIGGESTGPGSKGVTLEEELARVIPVLKALRPLTKLPISIDTYKSEVARQALELGANIINDVTGLRGDPKMAKTITAHNAQLILMYAKDPTARTTVQEKHYNNVIATIAEFFRIQIAYAESQGLDPKNIILDPGMGQFISSIPKYSFEIIERLGELKEKFPNNQLLVGISRKSFLSGDILERDELAKPLTAIAIKNGASIIRTHDAPGVFKVIQKTCQH